MNKKIILAVLTLCLCACGVKNGTPGSGETSREAEIYIRDESAGSQAEKEFSDRIEEERLSFPVSDKTKKDASMQEFVRLASYKGRHHMQTREHAMLVIDLEGTSDGEVLPGMSLKDYQLTLGSGMFIEGFEEALMGHFTGDTVEFDLAFPDPYEQNPSLSGKEAHWKVDIKEFSNEGYFILQDIEEGSGYIGYPKDDYEEVSEYILDYYKEIAEESYGISLPEFLSISQIDLTEKTDSNLRDLVAAEAVLEAEGVDEDSEIYRNAVDVFLEANEVKTIQEAEEKGIPAAWIRLSIVRRTAYDIILSYIETEEKT